MDITALSEGEVLLLIDNRQSCCENWGYITSEDNLDDFVGSNLLEVKIVDAALNPKVFKEAGDLYEGDAVFLNLETDKGTLQFAVYNEHNGYYSHDVIVKINEVITESSV